MKKAKQILALMLVVVMALGMMVFTTASAKNVKDYPDADSIEYKEAVDVLTALGVFVGDDNGSFGPQLNFTREQAAKIMTYILIGTKAADRLGHSPSSFTDVATDRWSNPYIEYCVNSGVIVGRGDGTFAPADNVTASQMAKMLLVALGYGGKGEYTGDRWELNAIVDGQKRGILDIDADYTKAATREEVARYTFNTIRPDNPEAYLVTYNTLIGDYVDRGNSIFTSSNIQTFLGTETFDLYAVGKTDPLGYGGRYWQQRDGVTAYTLTGYYRTDNTLYRSTDGTEIKSSIGFGLTDLGSMFFKAELKADTAKGQVLTYFINGAPATFDQVNAKSAIKGVIVDLIDSNHNGYADRVVIIEKNVATILADPTPGAFGAITIFGVPAPTGGNSFTAGKVVYPSDLKSGDIVLYYYDSTPDGKITYIEKAEAVSGSVTAHNKSAQGAKYDTATLNGTAYGKSGLTASLSIDYDSFASFVANIDNFGIDATAYLDEGKNIVAIKAEEIASSNYLVLVDLKQPAFAAQAEVVLSDGSYRIVDVNRYVDKTGKTQTSGILGKVAADAPGTGGTAWQDCIYAYTVDSAGKYTLKYVNNREILTDNNISQKAAYTPGFMGDDSTIFLVRSGSNYRVYTGVKNAPVFDSGNKLVSLGNDGTLDYYGRVSERNSVAKLVFLAGTPTTAYTSMMFFPDITAATVTSYNDGTKYYTIQGVDTETGGTKPITFNDSAYGTLVTTSSYKASHVELSFDGDIVNDVMVAPFGTPGTDSFSGAMAAGDTAASGGTIMLGGTAYRYNASTKVYFVNALMGSATLGNIGSIAPVAGSYFFGQYVAYSGDVISELYIITADQVMFVTPPVTATLKAGTFTQGIVQKDVTSVASVDALITAATVTISYVEAPSVDVSPVAVLGWYADEGFTTPAPTDGTNFTGVGTYYALVGYLTPLYSLGTITIPVTVTP